MMRFIFPYSFPIGVFPRISDQNPKDSDEATDQNDVSFR